MLSFWVFIKSWDHKSMFYYSPMRWSLRQFTRKKPFKKVSQWCSQKSHNEQKLESRLQSRSFSIYELDSFLLLELFPLVLGWQTFPVKCQTVNIFSFAGHMVSAVTIQLCHYSMKEAKDNTKINGCDCVLVLM